MNLILLPRWVESALRARGASLPLALTDLDALSTILSPDDVAFYVFINRERERFIGPAISHTFMNPFTVIRPTVYCGDDASHGNWERCYEQYQFGNVPDTQTVWFGEVMGFDAHEYEVNAQPTLQADILSYDTVVIRPVQRKHGAVSVKDNMQALHTRLLSLLYTQTSFETLASKELFSTWIRGMRNSA